MKSLFVVLATSAIVMSAGTGALQACGAKFLVATKAAHLQKIKRVANPARILVYQHSDEPDDTPEIVAEATSKLRQILEGAGHDVVVAQDENALRDLSRDDDIDVVMLALPTARRLKRDVETWSPGMHILPITDFQTKAQKAAIRDEFGEVFVTGDGLRAMLDSVERSYQRN